MLCLLIVCYIYRNKNHLKDKKNRANSNVSIFLLFVEKSISYPQENLYRRACFCGRSNNYSSSHMFSVGIFSLSSSSFSLDPERYNKKTHQEKEEEKEKRKENPRNRFSLLSSCFPRSFLNARQKYEEK